jgi:hypothetical protein
MIVASLWYCPAAPGPKCALHPGIDHQPVPVSLFFILIEIPGKKKKQKYYYTLCYPWFHSVG